MDLWRADIPLMADDVTVGRLTMTGPCSRDSVCTSMGSLIAHLKRFEAHMIEMVSNRAKPEVALDQPLRESTPSQPDAVSPTFESE